MAEDQLILLIFMSRLLGKMEDQRVMPLTEFINEIEKNYKITKDILNLLREVSKLNTNRDQNLSKIRVLIFRLKKMATSYTPLLTKKLQELIDQLEMELKSTENELRRLFGVELEQELNKLGLTLTGHYPEFIAGLFTIESDFEQWKATIWYGPKQEKIDTCSLSVAEITKRVEKAKNGLGSGISEEDLLDKLHQAYRRIARNIGDYVPIIDVLGEMVFLLQNKRFRQDPRKEHFKSYSRADFSFDLFRLQKFIINNPSFPKLRLKIATRIHTRQRSNFLWVPERENGRGGTYSHLRFEEDRI